ncbi:MAG: DEAD/DEAH box helicase [Rikenellaceae bacterium]
MELLNNEIITSALKSLNIEKLNPMQLETLHRVPSHKDVVLLSPTGSGKTIAFILPLLLGLRTGDKSVQALILVPSRELALQIESVFKKVTSAFKCCCCYGGHPIAEEKRSIIGNSPAVIIGTPGRIGDHIAKGNFNPTTIETLIIDEFDKSLEFGFHDEMIDIISQLRGLKKRILLSATNSNDILEFTPSENNIKLNYLPEGEQAESRLMVKKVISPSKDKIETLYKLLCSLGSSSSIVFCNHRDAVDRVSGLLNNNGLYSESFHGGMEQPERERALYKYRNGSCHVLVSTDLAARGLDIPEVEHIIHYHMPVQGDAYTHRNGRTARWEASGTSYILLSEEENLPKYIESAEQIELHALPEKVAPAPKPIWETLYIGRGKKEKISKMDVAGFLYKKGGLERDDVGSIDIKEHYGFVAVRRSKLGKLMKNIKGEKLKGTRILIEIAK